MCVKERASYGVVMTWPLLGGRPTSLYLQRLRLLWENVNSNVATGASLVEVTRSSGRKQDKYFSIISSNKVLNRENLSAFKF